MSGAITGPIALYNNVPINAQYYQPSVFIITGITLGATTLITTNVNHNYVVGQTIRTYIPPTFGTRQLNRMVNQVTSIPAPNQVVINVNSLQFSAYISSTATTKPQIVAVGDTNNGLISTTGRIIPTTPYIPGSFINISPL